MEASSTLLPSTKSHFSCLLVLTNLVQWPSQSFFLLYSKAHTLLRGQLEASPELYLSLFLGMAWSRQLAFLRAMHIDESKPRDQILIISREQS